MQASLSLALAVILICGLTPPVEAQVVHTLDGDKPWDGTGSVVAAAGDLNGDGFGDLLVGRPSWDGANDFEGRVTIYSGFDGTALRTYTGGRQRAYLGWSVASIGDLTGDTVPEFAIGELAQNQAGGRGKVHIYSGSSGAWLRTIEGYGPKDSLGYAVAGVGDLNNDGVPDLAIGAPEEYDPGSPSPGYVKVVSGVTGVTFYKWTGAQDGDRFGQVVVSAGDVNQDHVPDVLVGSPMRQNPIQFNGYARVHSGADGSVLYTWSGTTRDAVGSALAGVGDLNGDGHDDVLIGAPAVNSGQQHFPGQAWVYSGFDGSILHHFTGDADYDRFGSSVAGLGDWDGDLVPDFAIGAEQSSRNGSIAGMVRVYSGATGTVIAEVLGDQELDLLGAACASAGDVNGDGVHDLAAGATAASSLHANQIGFVRVYAGGPPLGLSEPNPGTVGGRNTITVDGASSGNRVLFTAGTKAGITSLNCRGSTTDVFLQNAKLLGQVTANGQGVASLTRKVPTSLSGLSIRLQALEFESCRFSSLVVFTFP